VSTKRPREESQAGPSGARSAPGSISWLDRDNGRKNQGTKVRVLNKKAKQELIVNTEKFKIINWSPEKLLEREPGRHLYETPLPRFLLQRLYS
jgi:hypothetical protein